MSQLALRLKRFRIPNRKGSTASTIVFLGAFAVKLFGGVPKIDAIKMSCWRYMLKNGPPMLFGICVYIYIYTYLQTQQVYTIYTWELMFGRLYIRIYIYMLSFWEEAAALTVGFRECYTHYNQIYSKYLDINWMRRNPLILLCIFEKWLASVPCLMELIGGQDMVDCSILISCQHSFSTSTNSRYTSSTWQFTP